MDYYVGLDVSLRSVAICVVNSEGQHIFERSVACEIDDIRGCISGFRVSDLRIGFEAGGNEPAPLLRTAGGRLRRGLLGGAAG